MPPTKKTTHGGKRPGAGRPRLPAPKVRHLGIRLDETTDAAFRARCAEESLTPSDAVKLLVEAWLMGRVKL